MEVSLDPPGALAPADTPQMVLVTFDDAVVPAVYDLVQSMATNRCNPNGSGLQFTFFVSTDWTDYSLVNKLHADGHEIAVHTMLHETGTNTTEATWRSEIAGARRTLSRLARVPAEDIVGFRAPFLRYNNAMFRILAEQGFCYDASITEAPGGASRSQGAGAMIWPYTLDHGVQQNTWTGERPYENFAGLFEIPLWSQMNDLGSVSATMDPSGSDAEVLALLQFNFTARYTGNRAPLGVFLHGGQWTSRAAVLGQFIDWVRPHSNVWFVSVRVATDYIRNPCGLAGSAAFRPFVTPIRSPWPADDLLTKAFSKGTVRSCGESPPKYPAPDTVYFECAPLPGGTAGMVSTGLWSTGFNATLCLTNDTSESASEWMLSFTLLGGEVTWLAGGTWTREGNQVRIRPPNSDALAPGGVVTFSFGGTRTTNLEFDAIEPALYEVRLMHPSLLFARPVATGGIELEWDDSAFGYVVEESADGLVHWTPVETVRGRTRWSPPVGPFGPPRAYRVRTTD